MIKGKISIEQLTQKIAAAAIDTVIVGFTDHYGRLMGKRFDADFFVEVGIKNGTHACDYLLTTDMEMEPVKGYDFANWQLGYGDFHLVPDWNSLRIASWLEKTALVLCDVVNEESHQLIPIAPRNILKKQTDHLYKAGYHAFGASELEYYVFKNSYQSAFAQQYTNLQPAGWYLEDYHILQGTRTEEFTAAARRHLKNSGIPVENSKGEWGKGQHELNIRYAEPLEMADRHLVFKQCLKEVADKMGWSVTFMAKYHQEHAGSSCHIHLSLWKDGKNIFSDPRQPRSKTAFTDEFYWFLGGWMKYVPDVMLFYAPTVNSYKRYVDGSWAPTRLAWSLDNRTAGFRVVGQGDSMRIECRIPGADCNPYLAFAAALASGLEGIKQKITPPEMFSGDVYEAAHIPQVPRSLQSAVDLFSKSNFVEKHFGKEVQQHYSHFAKNEITAYSNAVTDWERKRYFERI